MTYWCSWLGQGIVLEYRPVRNRIRQRRNSCPTVGHIGLAQSHQEDHIWAKVVGHSRRSTQELWLSFVSRLVDVRKLQTKK